MLSKTLYWLRIHPRWSALIAAMLLLFALDRLLPPPIPDIQTDGATVVLARDGTPLRAFANSSGVWRYPVAIDDVSPRYLEALLGYEDRWFRWHPGINPLAFARASAQALWHREIVSGGSTLTMQVARLIEPIPHSAFGKLRQIVRALQLELRLSKDEILTLYLNLAPFGGGIEGVQAASYAYLGKPSKNLSHAEAALLAVLPQAPSRLRPDRHPERARAARDKVLGRLASFGDWPASVIAEAADENVVARQLRQPLHAALLAERLRRQYPDARSIVSTIDADLQRATEERLRLWIERLPDRTSAAALIVDNATLEARAYVGSAQFGDESRLGHVDMIGAERSPGSTLKPFLYGLALDDGLIHSESLLLDVPQDFAGYRPANFGDSFNGPVAASEALRLSLNVPAVDLIERVTPNRFVARLRNSGVELTLPKGARPNLSMILGGTAARMDQLVGAYTALARGGVSGRVRLSSNDSMDERRLLSEGSAWIIRQILEDHGRPGDPSALFDSGRRTRVAWKTGTSYGFRDAWAIGVTPHYTIGVWVGRPDGTPSPGQYGAATALPLLLALVDRLPRSAAASNISMPSSVHKTSICWPLGEAPDPAQPQLCQRQREAWVLDNVVPPTLPARASGHATSYRLQWLRDRVSGARLLPSCESANSEIAHIAQWPVLAGPWLSRSERAASTLPALAVGCDRHETDQVIARLHIEGVLPNATLRTAPGTHQLPAIRVRALGARGIVNWLLDGRLIAQSLNEATFDHRFERSGEVALVAVDQTGAFDRLTLRVQR
jgi:penicillin-binding protein 1C